jgi:hypothetical protein
MLFYRDLTTSSLKLLSQLPITKLKLRHIRRSYQMILGFVHGMTSRMSEVIRVIDCRYDIHTSNLICVSIRQLVMAQGTT